MKVYYFCTDNGYSIPEIQERKFVKETDYYLTIEEGYNYSLIRTPSLKYFFNKEEAEEAWRTYACNVVMRLEELLRDAREKQLQGPIVKNE
jgi:hypothetical protein